MNVTRIQSVIQDAELKLSMAQNNGISVSPSNRLTDELRQLIRHNRATLIEWLQANNDPTCQREPTKLITAPKPAICHPLAQD